MKARAHPNITRARIETISYRTKDTTIPKLNDAFCSDQLDGEMCQMMIDSMIFSPYPNADTDGALALSAFLSNTNNISELKLNGSLGAIIELLKRADFHSADTTEHCRNLVQSLHKLCICGDKAIIERLISHPNGVKIVLKLCKETAGAVQEQASEILIAISKLESGIQDLVRQNVMDTLMTREMLFSPSTNVEVRHCAANLVSKITSVVPEAFPVERFIALAVDESGKRRIDPYQEIQLLQGLIIYWNWLTSEGRNLDCVFTLFKHMLNELEFELFDNLDHCVLIVKCCVLASKDIKQVDFMLENNLAVALQYLVRTDFTLYRKKSEGLSESSMKSSLRDLKKKTKKLSFQDSGNRSTATLMALLLVNPHGKKGNGKATEDTNIFATRSVVAIYENILEFRSEVISDIVSSGLIPALLFRVGLGSEKDFRYLKIAVQFVYSILIKVLVIQPHKGEHIATIGVIPRSSKYRRIGDLPPSLSGAAGHSHSHSAEFRSRVSGTDMRLISNTFHCQGITDVLLVALSYTDDTTVVQKALICLAVLDFQVVHAPIYDTMQIRRIFSHCTSRVEWHFPALALMCSMIAFPGASEDNLMMMGMELKGIKLLVSALRLTTWEFPMKDTLYNCMIAICHLPGFRDKISEFGGLSILLTEVFLRKSRLRALRKARLSNQHDDGTEKLYSFLRRDVSALRIQSFARAVAARRRVATIRRLKS